MKRKDLGLIVLLAGLALSARLIPGPRTIDDAFITFRYARNLLSGQGFVYNPEERVMGTTTPFYTLLMAGGAAMLGGLQADFSGIALGVNAIADALTCLILWQVGKRLGSEWAGIAAGILWALAPFSVTFAIGGLETSVYVLLLNATIYFYLSERTELAALSGGLALLTRVDALVLAAPMGMDWLVRTVRKHQPFPWKALLWFLIPVVGWYGFAWYYFGSPFPHSVTAKLVAYRLESGAAMIRLIQHYATPFFENNLFGPIGIGVGMILYPFLFLLGARKAWREDTRSLVWAVYPWLYFLAFAIPNPLIFRWYLTPPLPAYFLFILLGLDQILRQIFRLKIYPSGRMRRILAGGFLVLLPLVPTMSEWRLRPDHGPDRPAPDMAFIQLEILYHQAADFIAPRLVPGAVLAAGDVGVLGFQTNARILDTVGLNSPEASRYYPLDPSLYEINYAVAPDLILDEKPDAVIILEVYGRKGLLKDPRFTADYRLVDTIDTDMYGSRGLLIYEKVH
jgi:arabinofuranosyltransferase